MLSAKRKKVLKSKLLDSSRKRVAQDRQCEQVESHLGKHWGGKDVKQSVHHSVLCPRFLADELTLKRRFRSVHHSLL